MEGGEQWEGGGTERKAQSLLLEMESFLATTERLFSIYFNREEE